MPEATRKTEGLAMESGTGLKSIGQILVPVSDVDRAVTFYEEILGLPVLMRFPGIAFMDAQGIRLYLATVPEVDFRGRATIYFWVDDVSALFDRFVERGATPRQRPHIAHDDPDYDLWMAFVTDPDGNHVGIMREAPKGLEAG
jgi:catechol 2,3-dioxygenase-like lactoylglutathione lyase family enzyme